MFNKKRIIAMGLLGVMLLTGCGMASEEKQNPKESEATTTLQHVEENTVVENTTYSVDDKKDVEPTTEESTEESKEINLIMVGDILLHDRVEECAVQEDGSYNYESIFAQMTGEIKAADVALVNQEVIIGGKELGISGYPAFNAPIEIGDALVDAGFDVVCHGTNHAMDKGKKGILNCLNYWKTNQPQIAVLGINDSKENQDNIYVYEQDGIKVAILNYTYGTNGIPLPGDMPYAVDLLDKDKVVADIKKAEQIADFTVVCPHWGTEYVLEQTKEQERWAKIFLENGVDLVIGTHPHVIEPVEMMVDETTGNKMLVYYSIGNFVNWTGESGKGKADRMVGGMADVTIGIDDNGEVAIKDYSVKALVTHVSKKTNGVYTTRLKDYTEDLANTNEIRNQDSSFTKDYCTDLCDKVWGDLWE